MNNNIPLIDLTPARLGGDEGEQHVANQLDRACRDVGFFTVCGHGIDRSLFADVNAALRRFFALPLSEKRKCTLPDGPMLPGDAHSPYGYSGLLEENAYAFMGVPDQPNDCVEKFSVGRRILDDRTQLPFLDDEAGRDLRQQLKAYYAACQTLAAQVTGLLTIPLGLPRDFFATRIDKSNDSLRALSYPAYSPEVPHDQGMGEHTDGTLLTLLTHTSAAIQIRAKDGGWIIPEFRAIDDFIVNIGDLLCYWTKGEYLSTSHRVVLTDKQRQSIVFFKPTNEDELVEFGYKQMEALFGQDGSGPV